MHIPQRTFIMEPKRLYRSITDRKLAGVAGGIGEYFVLDPLLIRLVFVILTLAGGGGVLIYIVLWIVTPERPAYVSQSQAPPSSSEPTEGYQDNASTETNYTKTEPDFTSPSSQAAAPQARERNKGSLIGGLVLITIGALFLADELIPRIDFGDLWPLILVAIGAGLLINAFAGKSKSRIE
jgi:phage shock protein PspC (stress-responsive transcriptional regulator)